MQLLINITKKQQEIIHLIYRFRFLNRIQIQKLLKHKTYGRINDWLRDLVSKKYLGRVFENTKQGNSTHARYYLAVNGIKYLRSKSIIQRGYIKKLREEYKKSKKFINKHLFIADAYLRLREEKAISFYKFFTQSDFPAEAAKELHPDFGFKKVIGGKETYNVCKIIEKGTPEYAMPSIVQSYLDHFKNEVDLRILFICQTDRIRNRTYNLAQEWLEEEDDTNLPVFMSTYEKVNTNGIQGNIWERIRID